MANEKQTAYEVTPEIYGETRTRILVAKNCIEFSRTIPPEYLLQIREDLSGFLEEQFAHILNDRARSWSTCTWPACHCNFRPTRFIRLAPW